MSIAKLKGIRIIKSLLVSARHSGSGKLSVRVFRKSRFYMAQDARIEGCGSLAFGKPESNGWGGVTYFNLSSGAKVILNGNFTMFSRNYVEVLPGAVLILGNGFTNNGCRITCKCSITIGDQVAIGDEVVLRDYDGHELTAGKESSAPIVIGNHVWIGERATILKGVTIGDGAVIACNAVVTKDIPPNCLAAGVPARVIKRDVHWK